MAATSAPSPSRTNPIADFVHQSLVLRSVSGRAGAGPIEGGHPVVMEIERGGVRRRPECRGGMRTPIVVNLLTREIRSLFIIAIRQRINVVERLFVVPFEPTRGIYGDRADNHLRGACFHNELATVGDRLGEDRVFGERASARCLLGLGVDLFELGFVPPVSICVVSVKVKLRMASCPVNSRAVSDRSPSDLWNS